MSLVILLALLALIPAFIAARKVPTRPKSTFAVMYVFGLLLWIVALPYAIWLVKDERPGASGSDRVVPMHRECPHCKEQMRRDASVCPHCQRDSKAWVLTDDGWWVQGKSGDWYWLDEDEALWVREADVPDLVPPTGLLAGSRG